LELTTATGLAATGGLVTRTQQACAAEGEDKRTILVIGAHLDDCEIGAGGVIAKAVRKGHRVVLLNVASDYSTWRTTKGREKEIRQALPIRSNPMRSTHGLVGALKATLLFAAVVLLAIVPAASAEEVAMDVDLNKPNAADDWVFPGKGTSIHGGELVLDGLKQTGVAAFLKEPAVSDMTLTCRVFVEPKGTGVRAFQLHFRSSDSVSYQYVHVNRSSAILCWSNSDEHWNELARVGVKRPEGKWLDVKVECKGSAVRFYLDGKLVISKDNALRTPGRVGFSTSQGLVRVKDIRVEGTAVRLDPPWRIVPRPKRHGTFHELPAKYRHTDVSGKLDIAVSKPFIISSRVTRPEMGAHEQPHLFKLQNGGVLLVFHKDGDIHGAQRVCLRSRDKGKTWTAEPERVNRDEAIGALKDGTVLCYDCYSFLKGEDVYAKEMFVSRDGGATFDGPLLAMITVQQLGQTLSSPVSATRTKFAARYKKTSAQWSDVGGPNFWRTILELDDGSLLACGHTRFKGDKRLRSACYKSTDRGMTWRCVSTIAYDPNINTEGYVEPVMSKCADGSVLCVMRTSGHRPLMQARSRDNGNSWEPATKTGVLGVDPDLCLMTGGVLACSYGRPGNRTMFSVDGTGAKWTDKTKIYEYHRGSFGYTGIVEVEPGKLLFVYDRHDAFPEYGGKHTTAIQGVYITVHRTDPDHETH